MKVTKENIMSSFTEKTCFFVLHCWESCIHEEPPHSNYYIFDICPSPSPFLTVSLEGLAIVLVIQYFQSCGMSPVSWSFFVSSFKLSHHLFFGRPLPRADVSQKLLVSAISHRRDCLLASSSGQTTLMFCFPGKFQLVLCPAPQTGLFIFFSCI